MVTGTVNYRQRIALTADAVVTVRLLDQSRADDPAETIGEQVITNPGQVPIPFSLSYDPSRIVADHTYLVRAEISDRGRVLFRSRLAYPVITQGNSTQVYLVLEMVSETPPTGAGSLAGTSWVLTEKAAQGAAPVPAIGEQRPTLLFGSDGGVSGNSGCNSYGGTYEEAGNRVTFSPLVSTLRACLDPDLNAQEQLMYRVMNGQVAFTKDGNKLTLSAPAGMLVFAAATAGPIERGGMGPVGMPGTGAGSPAPGRTLLLLLLLLASLAIGFGAGLRRGRR
jgi:putative lipoprotein